jgi:glycosyltransferase involved in cell wall biosynthesis
LQVRPRILLDGYNLALDQGTGVATYARNLSRRLGALGAEVGVLYGNRASRSKDPVLREVTFFDPRHDEPQGIFRRLREVRSVLSMRLGERALPVPSTGLVIRNALEDRLPHFDRLYNAPELFRRSVNAFDLFKRLLEVEVPDRPDVAHWTYPLPLRVPRARNIYTIHDLVPLRLPYTTLDRKRRHWRLCQEIARRADHIVTVSEASRQDIIRILGVPEDRVTNTYQAVALPGRYADKPEAHAAAEVEGAFGLEWHGYHLFFGAIEPKKNVGRMIEAYLASGASVPLVLLGKKAWQSEEELRLVPEEAGAAASSPEARRRLRVIRLDYAPLRLLVSLVRGARSVIFPSLYEGFGLPVLEAMSLGTPVITSNTSSLPEVAGDAAMMVDPYDIEALTRAIREVDADAGLRAELSRRGPAQARLFSPAAYDARLRELYGRLGVGFGPG